MQVNSSPVPASQLVLGGARSGKSRRALFLAESLGARRVFIATAEALDEEMAARIARHKRERGSGWSTIEAPLDLVSALGRAAGEGAVCVVDCLTLWLSNVMHHDGNLEAETEKLRRAITSSAIPVVLVSNEVGLGLVPETPLGRAFRDAQGRLNQDVARICERVEFVAAGLPLTLKG
ncbi:MAG: bifunctional adenosylcobinamide kinase/adenosylcobinamide-phosphate guanylyltransferase [Pseudomonadota bacterium]